MIRRALLVALSVLAMLSACGESGKPRFQNPVAPQAGPTPAFSLKDDRGQAHSLNEFRGQVVIALFGFTHCQTHCPSTLRKYATLLRNLNARDAERIRVVFITLDPARDAPAVLGNYVRSFNAMFIPLTGDALQIAAVSGFFDANYRNIATESRPGQAPDHAAGAYVIDPKGQLRLYLPEHALIEPIASDLRLLLAGH
jgi:protein SCO1